MPRYIDAERFSERFDMMCDAGGVLAPITEAVREMVKKFINAEPTVDVQEIMHGRWIKTNPYHYKCSSCGARVWIKLYPLEEHKFCWHCGAKMDLEDGEVDEAD